MSDPDSALLTPREVARLFRVDPKTVTRWAMDGRLPSVRTLGGHRRYPAKAVYALLGTPSYHGSETAPESSAGQGGHSATRDRA